MRSLCLALGMALVLAMPVRAQEVQTISPGMTVAEVRTAFGPPAIARHQDPWTYLFYANGCAPGCGSDDVVFVRDGRVVAAVLRSPGRRFDGPAADAALRAAASEPAGERGSIQIDTSDGGVVRGIRIETPAARAPREPPVDLGVIRGNASDVVPVTRAPADSVAPAPADGAPPSAADEASSETPRNP